jgi:hypothetical protein
VKRLHRIGFDFRCDLAIGSTEPRVSGGALDRIDRIEADALARRLTSPDPPVLVDVRGQVEWDQGWMKSGIALPLSRLVERRDVFATDRPSVV